MCNFNISNSPVSVCCELNYPENCENEIQRRIFLNKEESNKEYKAKSIEIKFEVKDNEMINQKETGNIQTGTWSEKEGFKKDE